ncbi:MAG: hypothetical protein OXU31_04845 [Gammaproteobacteria bacterium]|nr:hypothetical protein [Gammaproteobacteria bacterium]
MLTVYFNYPNSYISIHGNSDCGEIPYVPKPNQREVDIHSKNVDTALQRFNEYRFGATAERNDMWVSVCLGDMASEMEVINKIKKILGGRYKPFRDAKISRHC